MSQCIFCAAELSPSTKPEHVWLAALGGRKTTSQTICSACNNALGSGPDKALADSVMLIRNLLSLPSGRGASPPAIRGLRNGADRIVLQPGGIPEIEGGRPFVITQTPDGAQSVSLRGASAEKLRQVLPHLAAGLKIPVDDVKSMLRSGTGQHSSQRVEGQHHVLQLGGPEPMRSMLKTCMTLWADRHGSDELQKPIYDIARKFVRDGGEEAAKAICEIDFGPLQGAEHLTPVYGPDFNFACVASDGSGRAVGYVRIYNMCAWRFTLCTRHAPKNTIVAYASNPRDPRRWSSVHNESLMPATAILDTQSSHDFSFVRDALVRINADYHQRASELEIGKIFESAADAIGLGEDEPMTTEQMEMLVRQFADRMTKWLLRLPHDETLSPDDIARLLDGDE